VKTTKKPLMTGYMAVWPTQKLVKVKIEPCQHVFPFVVSAVDPLEKNFESFPIADLSFVKLYKTEKEAEKGELAKLHKQYSAERRALRVQQQRYKWALRQIEDYKHFGSLQNPIFTMK
jgi:hypothetical protein